ncbi:hypothetical protein PAXRUDRAFT_23207 [Paxillus rubicundulus Ve08.2h10]|uniref:Uncharacterized protein n=1 Tax=Paxillus rubicundulus Ve08.2h10 TaxID=930991 RepID=A0A0D0DY18_9AGAM|nr:hypothetical protein PAXRUDRAFT_23207 [Paxillus rubicundulus Ve08.2h10]
MPAIKFPIINPNSIKAMTDGLRYSQSHSPTQQLLAEGVGDILGTPQVAVRWGWDDWPYSERVVQDSSRGRLTTQEGCNEAFDARSEESSGQSGLQRLLETLATNS